MVKERLGWGEMDLHSHQASSWQTQEMKLVLPPGRHWGLEPLGRLMEKRGLHFEQVPQALKLHWTVYF